MRGEVILIGLINIIVGIVEIFLGLRLVLRFLGADPSASFVAWLYATTEPLLGPFRGMFPTGVIERGSVFEFSTLFAIFIYALVAWLLKEIIIFLADSFRRDDERVVRRETEVREYRRDE